MFALRTKLSAEEINPFLKDFSSVWSGLSAQKTRKTIWEVLSTTFMATKRSTTTPWSNIDAFISDIYHYFIIVEK
jgi:hypothetical protein